MKEQDPWSVHPRRAAVIGAGAWGTALARLLAENGLSVCLWAYEHEVAGTIRENGENVRFLPGVKLPVSLRATNSMAEAVEGAELLVFAVPSHVARDVLQELTDVLADRAIPIISATKGIEEETLEVMTQVLKATLRAPMHPRIAVLSGPSFATEVATKLPTAVTLAGDDAELVRWLQGVLMAPYFRVYSGSDVLGVQLGGALKNVMALAAGAVDGLALGHNTRAALITRGLAEMIRLGVAMGADARTFYGLSGVGDLVLTCTGPLSRNHTVGVRLGRGERLQDILSTMHAVAEGVRTCRAAQGLAERYVVDMPIVQEVHAVLFDGKSCRRAVSDLMERSAKDELGRG